jgi:hypothetical protein
MNTLPESHLTCVLRAVSAGGGSRPSARDQFDQLAVLIVQEGEFLDFFGADEFVISPFPTEHRKLDIL